MHLPEPPRRGGEAQAERGLPAIQQPAQRGPEVVALILQPFQPQTLSRSPQMRRRLLYPPQIVLRVAPTHRFGLAALFELLGGVGPDRL